MTRKTVRLSIGTRSLESLGREFVDNWRALEAGAPIAQTHIHFQSLDDAAKVLTPKRQALLRYVRRHKVRKITEIAAGVERSYKNVHQDVKALLAVGLLEKPDDAPYKAPFDVIRTDIRL